MSSVLSHPQLSDCRRIFLRRFEIAANIGVHDFERQGAQRLIVDVDLYVSLAATTPSRDRIDEVLDYDFIHATIRGRVAAGHIDLQETLVDDIARLLLVDARVRAVRVSTEKPDVYPDCDAVGIEVFRLREEPA